MTDLNDAVTTLREYRKKNERKSREVYDIWVNYLASNLKYLKHEKHLILEDVIMSSLDCHKLGTAQFCIENLRNEFPNSLRVKRFEAMCLEAQGKYTDALAILEYIIKKDETNSAARKRKVAILKADSRPIEAIKELVDYLKLYAADMEAWQELCDMYLEEQDYNKAAFCIEELILQNPHNHLLYQRYADIKYTQGGVENLELAKSYYCETLKLNISNMRALYGLYLTLTAIGFASKTGSHKKRDNHKLLDWTLRKINNRYNTVDNLDNCLSVLRIM